MRFFPIPELLEIMQKNGRSSFPVLLPPFNFQVVCKKSWRWSLLESVIAGGIPGIVRCGLHTVGIS
eukprot:TRINITY_DN13565_c0_g1_i1.p3 TRINITY_DN13565_c0_g1~~TRINITY_DN13565_c0_g1_i1.p3  ORF type:complete len:66 (+),score=2.54 TRINITY_DN13565_c0_g1_i1:112-309(+)